MFFITEHVMGTETYRSVMERYGLSLRRQGEALSHRHNNHLRVNGRPPSALARPRGIANLIIPLEPEIEVLDFTPVVDLSGLSARRPGDTSPLNTHGMRIKFSRSYGAGSGLNWIQTVRKVNNPDPEAPLTFVDGGRHNKPYYYHPEEDGLEFAPVHFVDTPSAPVAAGPRQGVDFTATTTLAVTVRSKIVLAAGVHWSFTVNTETTLPTAITANQPRPAETLDFEEQLRILQIGRSQLNYRTGPDITYIIPTHREIIP